MAGPNSVPSGDKALYERLTQFVCIAHNDCVGDKASEKKPCVWVTRREWLLRGNRLVTGKTR
jgi:hypothetical protein